MDQTTGHPVRRTHRSLKKSTKTRFIPYIYLSSRYINNSKQMPMMPSKQAPRSALSGTKTVPKAMPTPQTSLCRLAQPTWSAIGK
jgi:hypothetical protein